MLIKIIRTLLIATAISVTGRAQADSVKIGFITTLTTPAGVIGADHDFGPEAVELSDRGETPVLKHQHGRFDSPPKDFFVAPFGVRKGVEVIPHLEQIQRPFVERIELPV